jgi:putative Holliday junction resolvase
VGRVLAVDPGDVRIGLAVSDPTRTIASPLKIIGHISRADDARAIANEALAQGADLILVGLALNQDGQPGPQARKALRFVAALRQATTIAVETWDETGSTQRAIDLGGREKGPVDDRAAAVLLQEYLNAQA